MLCRVLLMRCRGWRLPWREIANAPGYEGDLRTHYMTLGGPALFRRQADPAGRPTLQGSVAPAVRAGAPESRAGGARATWLRADRGAGQRVRGGPGVALRGYRLMLDPLVPSRLALAAYAFKLAPRGSVAQAFYDDNRGGGCAAGEAKRVQDHETGGRSAWAIIPAPRRQRMGSPMIRPRSS
jgi:hypothetical protein